MIMERMIARFVPDAIVIACNTASTLVLPHLRAVFPKTPFIGTVPAIKPAAAHSRSHMISVLATPGTVARDYTRDLVRTYAAHCEVTLVGSTDLASFAEAFMKGEGFSEEVIRREIEPCFVEANGRRTDCVVLACTHYPLLLSQFEQLAPWSVQWIDPAPAIARRTDHVLREELGLPGADSGLATEKSHIALFTSLNGPGPILEKALRLRGFGTIMSEKLPLALA
jgi:glutamate racemase